MNDCPNAGIRDLLCDVVHGTLADADRRRVEAHIAACADCAAELDLLRRARTVLARATPAVDTARIAAAIPRPYDAARLVRFSTWRIAATIAVVALGAASLSLLDLERSGGRNAADVVAGAGEAHTLSFAGRLSELNEEDLEQLIAEIDDYDGGIPAEPRAVLAIPAWDGGTQ
jgi:hypothetical protein